MINIYLIGMVLGFVAAIIPGPINIEVIRRSIRNGPKLGYAFGIGAITADVTYVASMSFGLLTLLAALPPWGKGIVGVVGGCLLLYMGLSGVFAEPPPPPDLPDELQASEEVRAAGHSITEYLQTYVTGIALTAISPSAFGFWITMCFPLANQLPALRETWGPLVLAAGVGSAIAIWIFMAVTLASGFFRRLKPVIIQRVEQGLGAVLLTFSLLAFYESVWMFRGHDPTQQSNSGGIMAKIISLDESTTETASISHDQTSATIKETLLGPDEADSSLVSSDEAPVLPTPIPLVLELGPEPGTTTGVILIDHVEVKIPVTHANQSPRSMPAEVQIGLPLVQPRPD